MTTDYDLVDGTNLMYLVLFFPNLIYACVKYILKSLKSFQEIIKWYEGSASFIYMHFIQLVAK